MPYAVILLECEDPFNMLDVSVLHQDIHDIKQAESYRVFCVEHEGIDPQNVLVVSYKP